MTAIAFSFTMGNGGTDSTLPQGAALQCRISLPPSISKEGENMALDSVKIQLNLDKVQFTRKPNNPETGALMNRLAFCQASITVDELAQAVEHGQSFTIGLKAGTKGDTWQSQQILAVDVDNDYKDAQGVKHCLETPLPSDDAIMLLECWGIEPAIVYETFSNTDAWPRYRIIIVLEEPLTDKDKARDYMVRLTALVNDYCRGCADTKIQDAARLLYGSGPGSVIYRGDELTPLTVLDALPVFEDAESSEPAEPAAKKSPVEYGGSYDTREYILEALESINPATLDYADWLKIGMALKNGGFDVDVWDTWSRNDRRYKQNDCVKRWKGFKGGVNVGSIIYIAKRNGWEPSDKLKAEYKARKETERFNSAAMDFNDWIEYDGYEAPAAPQEAQEQPQALPAEQAQGEALTAPQEAPRKPQRVDAFTSFMEKIQTEAYRPVRTGMGAFDRLLYGGIPRQSLIMLTAAPGAGKTTFCQQVFETAAALGTDVLFINLEMSREQLYSRSLSRLIHIQGGNMNAMQVMRGYKWTDEQRAYVESAAAAYQEKINPFMHYNPVEGTSDIELIMACLEKAASWCKKKGRNPPVAVIDYLHLITGKDDKGRDMDSATVIKLAVKRLKDWAVQNDSYVFAIGANNRAANSKGTITLESGRDSSAIEYSADIQLSLNYRALHEKRKINVRHYNEDTGEYEEKEVKATPENPDVMEALQTMEERDMILQTLKSRMIPARGKLYLRFNAGSSTFTPIVNPYDGDDFIEVEDLDNPWADEIEESDDYE